MKEFFEQLELLKGFVHGEIRAWMRDNGNAEWVNNMERAERRIDDRIDEAERRIRELEDHNRR